MGIESLSDIGAINALSKVGERFVKNSSLDPNTSVMFVTALVGEENVPDWAKSPKNHPEIAGPIAREVLKSMLKSGGRLATLAQIAVDEESRTEGRVFVEAVLAGMFILALASKVSYSKEKGIEIAPGFPGFAAALDSAAKFLGTIPGFTPPGSKS